MDRYICPACARTLKRFPTRCQCGRQFQNRRQATDTSDVPQELLRFESCEAFVRYAFGPDGYFAQKFPGYEPRPGQIELSVAIARAFEGCTNVLGEAGCGVGKSMAYLVPAVYMALKHRVNVLATTPIISLQEQLVEKDLPALQAILPFHFTFALYKGRSNYLCQHRLEEWQDAKEERAYDLFEEQQRAKPEEDAAEKELVAWAGKTTTGDRSDLPRDPPEKLWEEVCGSAEECACARRKTCFYWSAKDRAFNADILVANYHMLFTHLKIKLLTGADTLLPALGLVICDEGHELAEVARRFFGFELKRGAVKRQIRMLHHAGAQDMSEALGNYSAALFDAFVQRARRSNKSLITAPDQADYGHAVTQILQDASVWWDEQAKGQELAAQMASAQSTLNANEKAAGKLRKAASAASRRQKSYLRNATRCAEMADQLSTILSLAPDPINGGAWVYWIDNWGEKGGENAILCGEPFDVAAYLHHTLYREARSTVVVSATLSTGERDAFRYTRDELGFRGVELAVPSPFDFTKQGLLVVPGKEEMPCAPSAKEFPDYCAELTTKVLTYTRGRGLCLFTSYKNMNAVKQLLTELPYRLLMQGDGTPRKQLVEEFKRDKHSILLGVASMWQGLDVQGESCVAVVIDKLPFPGPDDPLCAWLEHHHDGGYAFRNYSLPRALIKLRQGVGRLIRSKSDYGVVVILDSRVHTKAAYKRDVLASLPPFGWVHPSIEAIPEFMRRHEPDDVDTDAGSPYPGATCPSCKTTGLMEPNPKCPKCGLMIECQHAPTEPCKLDCPLPF